MDEHRFGDRKRGQLIAIEHPVGKLPAMATERTPRFSAHRIALLAVSLAACFLSACGEKEPTPLENSIYPPTFDMEAFKSIQPGDEWEDVKALLGDPFGYYDMRMGRNRYVYSKPKDPAYRYAAVDVAVSAEGRVLETSIFYLFEE